MSISKLGTDVSASGNTVPGTLSVSHTLVDGSNRKIVCFIAVENGNTVDVSGVTYGGVAMSKAVEQLSGSSGTRFLVEMWYLDEANLPANGAQTCEVTFTGTSSTPETNMFVAEYGGIAQGAPASGDTDGTTQTSGTTISNTPLNAISSSRWALSCMGSGNTGTWTHGQSQTEVLDFNDASSTFAVAELRGGTGETSISSTYTGTVNRLCRVAAVWGEAASYNIELTAPARSVSSAPTQATIAVVDDTITFTIPHIQTSTTLPVSATVPSSILPSGGGVKFVLNEGLAGETVQYSTGGASPFSTNFTGLVKGTYTIDVYVVNSSNVVQGSYHDEATGIGIGDIICAIGDSATGGRTSNDGGAGSATAVLNWTTAVEGEVSTDNRNFRQNDPEAAVESAPYFLGFPPRLNNLLTAAYGYPVFIMNEGVGGITTQGTIDRMATPNWQNRIAALQPNKWLIHLGGNDAGSELAKATVKANLQSIIATLKSTYGATASNIWLARTLYLRNYESVEPYAQDYRAAEGEIVAAGTCQAGPDFYTWFYNHPEQQDTPDDVHPNAAGHSAQADLWNAILYSGAFTTPNLDTGAPTLGQPALTQTNTLTTSGLAAGAVALGQPALTQTQTLTANALTSGSPALGQPALTQTHAFESAALVSGSPSVGSPELSQTQNLTSPALDTGNSVVGSPALTQTNTLSASELASGSPSIGSPALSQTQTLSTSALSTSSPSLGSPEIGQTHTLSASELASGYPAIGSPALTQEQNLASSELASGSVSLGAPSIGQTHALTSSELAAGAVTLESPGLTQTHALATDALDSGSVALGQPAMGQVHTLTTEGLVTGAPTLGQPELTSDGSTSFTTDGIVTGAPTLGQPALTQAQVLTANALDAGAPLLGSPALGQVHSLSTTELATGAPILGQPIISMVTEFFADELLTGAPTLGQPELTQIQELLSAALLLGSPSLGSPIVYQVHTLTTDGIATGAPVLGSPAISLVDLSAPIWLDATLAMASGISGTSAMTSGISGTSAMASAITGTIPMAGGAVGT